MGEKEEAVKRLVLDTNILVSALLFKGRLARFVDLWKKGKIVPVITRETFTELVDVLHYPKFALADDEIQAIVEDEILPFFEVVSVNEDVTGVCRDPDDDRFLAAAVNSGAKWVVTGDRDLLCLEAYRGVSIVTPQKFLDSR
ncbi:MAG TPA: putative toxin-antitoxin system toxin component, PIN family [Geobacteraceae bacterium]|nr:putative toxin-antitoxin system toxin component, PIN family [Geobacteraceae bacterium]